MPVQKRLLSSTSSIAVRAALTCTVMLSMSQQVFAACSAATDVSLNGVSGCVDWQGGNLTIGSDGIISVLGETYAIKNGGNSVGSFQNAGAVSGAAYAVYNRLADGGTIGGTITNISNAGGLLSSSFGVFNENGSIATISNSGDIAGDDAAIKNSIGTIGVITNDGRLISSAGNGLENYATIADLTNSGTITAASHGVFSSIAASSSAPSSRIADITNWGLIEADIGVGNYGLGRNLLGSSIGQILNYGTIDGGTAAVLTSGATIGQLFNTVQSLGGVQGVLSGDAAAIKVVSGRITNLLNAGQISASAADGAAISNDGGYIGALLNISSSSNIGTIEGATGIYVAGSGTIASIGNSGIIEGDTVGIATGTTGLIGTIINSGTVSGDNGISNAGTISIINNSGDIVATTYGLYSSGYISSLDNDAAISGGRFGVYNGSTLAVLTNSGTISGGEDAGIANVSYMSTINNSGTIDGQAGISFSDGGAYLIDNSGVISGIDSGLILSTSSHLSVLNNSGTISGYHSGLDVNEDSVIDTLNNTGSISGIYGNDAVFRTINNDGHIASGISLYASTLTVLENSGSIGIGADDVLCGGGLCISGGSNVGTIVNDGSMVSYWSGISAYGSTIGDIINNGSIIGGYSGISSSGGTIGTIYNYGLIQGTGEDYWGEIYEAPKAIYISNNPNFSYLNNYGTISGNIEVSGSGGGGYLVIGGGTETTYGIISGVNGEKGVISANVLQFAPSSYQALNSDISVSGVVNSGTVRVNSPITIFGTYTQPPSGTLEIGVTNSSTYGSLTVTSDVNMLYSKVRLVPVEGELSRGTSYTIVSGAGSAYYDGLTIVAGGNRTSVSYVSDGYNRLVVNVLGAQSYSELDQNSGLSSSGLGSALDTIQDSVNQGGSGEFAEILEAIETLSGQSDEAAQAAIQQLAPNQVGSQVATATVLSNQTSSVVGRRMDAISGQGSGYRSYARRGRSSGSSYNTGSLWAQASGGGAHRDSEAGTDGYSQGFAGLTFGADAKLGSNFTLGEAVSWLRSVSRGSGGASGSEVNLNSLQLTTYGTYRSGPAYVEGMFNLAFDFYNATRDISFLGVKAKADYEGMQYSGKVEAGWDIPVDLSTGNTSRTSRNKAWRAKRSFQTATVTPIVGIKVGTVQTSGYTETGAGAANISVQDQDVDNLSSLLGGKVSTTVYTNVGVLTPEIKLMWEHGFADDNLTTRAAIGGVGFTTQSTRVARDGMLMSMGGTLAKSDSLSISVQYDADLRSAYQSHAGMMKLNWKY